jgi:hypothetical protein
MYSGRVSSERRYLDPCHLLTSVIVFCFHQIFLFAIFYSITNATIAIVFRFMDTLYPFGISKLFFEDTLNFIQSENTIAIVAFVIE